MLRLNYLKMGNMKISKKVARFDLPTSVCGQKCPKCYANKMLFPQVVAYRQRCLDLAESDQFISTIDAELKLSKAEICRPHCSGDFYSDRYVKKWAAIARKNPNVKFFAWTKKIGKLDFSPLENLANFNLMNSMTPTGYNYGDVDYVNTLVKDHGYFLCPDQGSHNICMSSCTACLTKKKVCFIIH